MKKYNRIWISPLIVIVFLIILTNSCKKDDDNKGPVPVLTTSDVSDITQTTAACGGTIISEGGSSIIVHGVCWSIDSTPVIADNRTIDSSNVETFMSNIIGLSPNTEYYVRAYASNVAGTGYGNAMLLTTENYGTVADVDGNVYKTIAIGTQTWMIENLKVTRYRNGELIGTTTPATLDIMSDSTPRYQWAYDGNESNVDTYGRLYTWHAVHDSREIAPTGWHVSTYAEWTTLTDYLTNNGYGYQGSGSDIGKSMATKSGWTISDMEGAIGNDQASNNSSGFRALPGGARESYGSFADLRNFGVWWSSTEYSSAYAYFLSMHYIESDVSISHGNKEIGFSVRCLKD